MRRLAAAVLSGCVLSGCGGTEETDDAPASRDRYQAELFPSTVALDDAALDALEEVGGDGTLRFAGEPSKLEGLSEDTVIVAGAHEHAPDGLLRFVHAIERSDDGVVLHTIHAPLAAAFRKLDVHVERTQENLELSSDEPLSGRRLTALGPPFSQKESIGWDVVNGDGEDDTPEDDVTVTGELGGGFDYSIDINVDWDDIEDIPGEVLECLASNVLNASACTVQAFLPEVVVDFDVTAAAEATLELEGVSFLPYGPEPYSLGEVELTPIPFGLIVLRPAVEVRATIEGQAASRFRLGSRVVGSATGGVVWSSESPGSPSVTPPVPDVSFETLGVEATLSARSRVSVGPVLHLRLYGIAGPWAGLSGFAELRADRDESPCYEFEVGADLDMGFDIVVKDLPVVGDVWLGNWSRSFPLASEVVDSGDCAELPNGGDPEPVAGAPSDAAFANPTFTPWSTTHGGAVVSHPFEGPGAQLEWASVAPTIDGRFLVTGSNLDTLVKIDGDGEVVWAKQYVPPEPFNETVVVDDLLPSRAIDTGDAATLLLAHPYTLVKTEVSGEPIWSQHFDVPHEQDDLRFTDVVRTETGFVVGGTRGDDPNASAWRAWVLATDEAGQPEWSRVFGPEDVQVNVRALVPFDDGVVVVGDAYDQAAPTTRGLVFRLSAGGEIEWAKWIVAPECESAYTGSVRLMTVIASADGDLVVAGTVGRAPDATLVMKLKPDGALAWSATDMSPSPHLGPIVTSIVQLPAGGYLAAGTFNYWMSGGGNDDVWLGALDGVGRVQWMKHYGGERFDSVPRNNDAYPALLLTQDGGALLTAYTDSLSAEGAGLWTFKLPAKNGEIEFDGATTAFSSDLASEPNTRHCLVLEDAELDPSDEPTVPEPLELSVRDAPVTTERQAP